MENHTMIKMNSDEAGCIVRTVSRNGYPSQNFYILKDSVAEVEEGRKVLVRDGISFAEIRMNEGVCGKNVRMHMFWSKSGRDHVYTGWEEIISIPYEMFHMAFSGERRFIRTLSKTEFKAPEIVFESRKNLHEVVKHPGLRKKLGKFLSCHFQWYGSRKIVLWDDFLPYSFYFQEYNGNKKGICGGVILHGAENLKTASYSIHT